jgi:hypothetical protein
MKTNVRLVKNGSIRFQGYEWKCSKGSLPLENQQVYFHNIEDGADRIYLINEKGEFVGMADRGYYPIKGTIGLVNGKKMRTYTRGKYYFLELDGVAFEFHTYREMESAIERILANGQ